LSRQKQKLPLWRLAAGIAVFAGLIADLSLLAPVYVHNYELEQYIAGRLNSREARAVSDDQLRSDLMGRAKRLELPLIANDVHIEHRDGVTTLRTFYKIQVDLGLYTVDLHFRPEASSR
jgi:hypothetical protein